ncbi:MAG: ABC transporter ATP-binding protein [Actinomycetota bacterium]
MQPAIQIKSLSKSFGRKGEQQVISNLDLEVSQGEFLTVVGASGCGKSTLLNIIAGLDKPSSGELKVSGKVALMFQDATLLPWLTAIQNIKLALRLQGVKEPRRTERAKELLDLVRLGDAIHKRPHELSGGMKQRISLARCLAQDASIVLMDEPLGALDAMTRDLLHDEIESLTKNQGLTVVFVTHNMREAVRLGDRVVLMGSHPGRIVYQEIVDLPHPRTMDSPEIATRAARLTKELRAAQSGGGLIGADS